MQAGPADEPLNQAPPLAGYNVFTADTALVEAMGRRLAADRGCLAAWGAGRLFRS